MRTRVSPKVNFNFEYRFRKADGSYCWLHDSNTACFNENDDLEYFFGSAYDITERKQAEEELKRKNNEIVEFINTVSHDLRSPLVTIKTFLGYLLDDIAANNQDRIDADNKFINEAIERMECNLNELLELSRIGNESTSCDDVTFQGLLNKAMSSVAGQISKRKVEVRVSDADLPLRGDQRRLLQIWQNLLDNAVKYMGNQTAPLIEIGFELKQGNTIFYVCDNGVGIAPECREKVFGVFEQLDSQSSGVGMGLAMVKRIVELYGGYILVESNTKGQGSCFQFTLPNALLP